MEEKQIVENGGAGSWQEKLGLERVQIGGGVLPIVIVLTAAFGLGFVGFYFLLGRPWQWLGMVAGVAQALILFPLAYVLVRQKKLAPAVYLIVWAIESAALVGAILIEGWIIPASLLVYVAITFARLMFGRTHNRIIIALSGVVLVLVALFNGLGIVEQLSIPLWSRIIVWVSYTALALILVLLIQESRDERFERVLTQSEVLAGELVVQREALKRQTRDLARRARYLEATSRIARDAAAAAELQDLLPQAVTMISQQLDFYHVGIYLSDPSGEWLVLQAASSDGGRQMMAREHRLLIGTTSTIGSVVVRAEPRVVHDDGAGSLFAGNPDLRDTRSQVALPLRARAEIIGVLDVHSTALQAFDAELVAVLQALADQVAVAIYNIRLFQRSQESLEAIQLAYSEAGLERWGRLVRGRSWAGYRYDERGVAPLPETAKDTEAALPRLDLPITFGERTFGKIEAHKQSAAGDWTAEERRLVQTLTEQLSVALESAQLYEDTQRRATREQLTREITDDIRAATSVDDALQRAVRRLSQALQASQAVARIGIAETASIGETAVPGDDGDAPQEGSDHA